MNARIAGVLVVLLVALGGGALLVREQQGSRKPADAGTLGQPLLKGLQASQVAAIVIRQPKDAITIAKKDERWIINERAGFPADLEKVRGFVVQAISLKVGQIEPVGEKDRARLLLDAGGTAIEFLGADGKPLARLTAGRKYFRTEPENPEKAIGDGRYVALSGDEKRVVLVADPLAQASTRSADWISKAGFAAEKVKTMELRAPEGAVTGSSWRIERAGDNADWKLAGARGDEKIDVSKANAASYSLSLIELADVAPADARPEDTGLDKPTVVTAATLDGLTYTLKLGKLSGDNYYATVAIAGEPRPEGKDAEERLKKINERLPREKALAAHTLLVPKSKLEDVLRKRADLLVRKEEKEEVGILAKPLIFVHGFACTHADWQPLAAHFGASHPVFMPDLRGHGATHARPEDCSIETYGSDIAALLEGKDLKGAVLVGHSMGCRVVLQAFLNAPQRVAALVLVDGSYRGGGGDPLAAEQAGRAAIAADGYLEFQRRLFDGMFLAPSELARSVVDRAMRLPEAVGANLWPSIGRWDTATMETALAAVKIPLLVIQTTRVLAGGKRVAMQAGETSPWLDLVRRNAPQARIEIVSGVGHFPQLEATEAVARLLSELINA